MPEWSSGWSRRETFKQTNRRKKLARNGKIKEHNVTTVRVTALECPRTRREKKDIRKAHRYYVLADTRDGHSSKQNEKQNCLLTRIYTYIYKGKIINHRRRLSNHPFFRWTLVFEFSRARFVEKKLFLLPKALFSNESSTYFCLTYIKWDLPSMLE